MTTANPFGESAWTEFLGNARRAVERLGLWILRLLAKKIPEAIAHFMEIKIDLFRQRLKKAKGDARKKWLKGRISRWSWVLRWVKSIGAALAKKYAKKAEKYIVKAALTVVPDRSPEETLSGWQRMQKRRAARKTRRKARRKARKSRRKARRAA